MLAEGMVKVSSKVTLRSVALVKSLGFNLLSLSQLLDEGFEVRFKSGASRVLDSRGDLVCTIVTEGQIFHADFPSLLVLLDALLLAFRPSFGNGIGGWNT